MEHWNDGPSTSLRVTKWNDGMVEGWKYGVLPFTQGVKVEFINGET